MKLVAAVFALVALTNLDSVVARIYASTLWAGCHITVGLLEHVGNTRIVIGKSLIELLDGVSHYLQLYFKDYMASRDTLGTQRSAP